MKMQKFALFAAAAGFAAVLFIHGPAHASAQTVTPTSTDATTTAPSSDETSTSTATTTPSDATSSAPAVSADDCSITPGDIAQITAVQNDPTLTPSQEVVAELAVRKSLIVQTITCAQNDLQTLQSALGAVSVSKDADAATIQNQLESNLSGAGNFYALELSKVNDAGIAGTKAIASEILSWRQSTYAPLVGDVNNFVLWAGDQGLFSTAATRMTETQQAVAFLESASPNADLQTAFNAAYASFGTAKSDNGAAEAAFQQSLAPDQTLTLIKQSLGALQDTYQQFFTVSTIIQTLLPQ
jgi:hypothetical protein